MTVMPERPDCAASDSTSDPRGFPAIASAACFHLTSTLNRVAKVA